jgi:hypothetical protein
MSRGRAVDAEVTSEPRPGSGLLEPTLGAVDAVVADALVVGLCRDVRPLAGLLGILDWRLCGRLSRLVEAGEITGAVDERVMVPTAGMLKVPFVVVSGWGSPADARADGAARIAGIGAMLEQLKAAKVAFAFPEPARALIHLAPEVERVLGPRLAACFGADPLPPLS